MRRAQSSTSAHPRWGKVDLVELRRYNLYKLANVNRADYDEHMRRVSEAVRPGMRVVIGADANRPAFRDGARLPLAGSSGIVERVDGDDIWTLIDGRRYAVYLNDNFDLYREVLDTIKDDQRRPGMNMAS